MFLHFYFLYFFQLHLCQPFLLFRQVSGKMKGKSKETEKWKFVIHTWTVLVQESLGIKWSSEDEMALWNLCNQTVITILFSVADIIVLTNHLTVGFWYSCRYLCWKQSHENLDQFTLRTWILFCNIYLTSLTSTSSSSWLPTLSLVLATSAEANTVPCPDINPATILEKRQVREWVSRHILDPKNEGSIAVERKEKCQRL